MNIINLIRHISFKHIKLQKAQAFMALSGICLGVAAMVSIGTVNRSVLNSFEDSIYRITGRAVLQITGAESGFPEELLDKVQNVAGVEYAVPVIETNAKFSGGKERSLMILGIDILQDSQIRDYSLRDETAEIPDPLLFLARSDSILLTRALAEREGISIDQQIQLQTVQGIKTFRVRGLLDPQGPEKASGGDIAVMDIYAAQLAFCKEKRIDRIDVSIVRGENIDVVKDRIRTALPEGYSVDTPAGRTKQIEILMTRFRKSISFISFMGMFVGMYLIYNAVSISVVQRRKEMGILRAIGATRGEIIRLFLGETFVISALGSLLGVGLGIIFAKLSIGVVAQSLTDIYMRTTVSELAPSWGNVVADVLISVIASLAAAAFPALSTTRITPISAIRFLPHMQDGNLLSRKIKIASGFLVLSSFLILAAYKIAGPSSVIRNTATIYWSMVFLLLGISLSTPVLLKQIITVFHRFISSRLGAGGRLAGLNLQKNISRNAVAVAAIFYSITLFVSSASMIYSTRIAMLDYSDGLMHGDILITSGHPLAVGGAPNIPMPGETKKRIENMQGVLSAEAFRRVYINYSGRRILLNSFDTAGWMAYNQLTMAEGRREDMLKLLPGQDNIVVNETIAVREHIKPGDSIILPTPRGPVRFGVAAIVVDYSADSGVVWIDTGTYQLHWLDTSVDMFSVRVKPNENISAVREAVLDHLGKGRKVFGLSGKEFKEQIRTMVGRSFLVIDAVNVITMIIAGFGIIVTLLASVLERTREIGILRSIGMLRNQISGLVIIESLMLGVAGGILGSAAGALVGWMNLEGFIRLDYGASVTYHIHYGSIGWALVISSGLSALGGLYPARRAAKTNIVEALAYE
jgi:putative ABC transport system permease protein